MAGRSRPLDCLLVAGRTPRRRPRRRTDGMAVYLPEESDATSSESEESEEDPVEEYFTPQPGENGISPRWPARLRALLCGSLEGGDPASSTGLLAGVAPMLLHKTQSPHPERPARVVAIYHELFEQELVSRARLVPARLASMEDLALVHDRKLVRRATATYDTDEDATAALGIERCVRACVRACVRRCGRRAGLILCVHRACSLARLPFGSDTYFRAKHSGYAARLSAGSVVELTLTSTPNPNRNPNPSPNPKAKPKPSPNPSPSPSASPSPNPSANPKQVVELATRVAQGELRNAFAVTRPPGHHCEQRQSVLVRVRVRVRVTNPNRATTASSGSRCCRSCAN